MSSDARSAAVAYGIAPAGARLPADTRVGPVQLQVSDLGRSLDYYRQVLGMRLLRQDGGRATLGAQLDPTPLIELVERPGARPVPRRGQLGLYHFAILLPDRQALGRFVRHLASVGARAGASDHLVSEALYLHDPDGLGIEVYADRPRSAWRVHETARGRELAMSTEPLDLDGLVRAAGDAPWTGMPPGTVMGHVHLHVGDLDRAAAFYHAALGLDAVVWSYPGALFLSAGGYHHHLGLNTWAGPNAAPATPSDAQLLEWTLLLPEPGAARRAAERLGQAGFDAEPSGAASWTVSDPWGTRLRLTASTGAA
ncbi:MAG TPA: VOC family protein [Gemmatimonadales bacterium]|nr:VOC family protein [Gemmatimonadales bacterium]